MHVLLRHPTLLSLLTALAPAAIAGGGTNGLTERVLFQAGGMQIHEDAQVSDLSADGRYAVVVSAEAFVAADDNGTYDVYVLDLLSDTLKLASVSFAGTVGNAASYEGRISDDGRYVVFTTASTNLVGLDFNGDLDVVRKDLLDGTLDLVSAPVGSVFSALGGSQEPDISSDGRYVAFRSNATNLTGDSPAANSCVYHRDMLANQLLLLTTGLFGDVNGSSYDVSISDDGMRVAYTSAATNLVLFDINGTYDVFVQDVGGQPVLVSKLPMGVQANSSSFEPLLSGDGRFVAFHSYADNFVAGDANASSDVFLAEVASGAIEPVSVGLGGHPAWGHSHVVDVSEDGRLVLFSSNAGDHTPEALTSIQLYMRDLQQQTTALVSRPSGASKLPNAGTGIGQMRDDGASAVFASEASNLDQGDTNGVRDLFERELFADPFAYCVSGTTSAGCQPQASAVGTPSAGAASGFTLSCRDVPNNQIGVLLYSFDGAANTPILGGTLCIGAVAGRSPGLFSGGNPGSGDCSGQFTLDMNAYADGALGGSPNPGLSVVGQQVNAQFWGRDPASALGFYFSEGLEYVVGL